MVRGWCAASKLLWGLCGVAGAQGGTCAAVFQALHCPALRCGLCCAVLRCCQGVLASGGEDNLVAVWSLDRAQQAAAAAAGGGSTRAAANGPAKAGGSSMKEAPPELMFKHVGHKGGVSQLHALWMGG